MSERREDVLERNLEALFTRAYEPVEPSALFRERLERVLAPWLAGAAPRRSVAPWLAAAAVLAAGLVAWRVSGARLGGRANGGVASHEQRPVRPPAGDGGEDRAESSTRSENDLAASPERVEGEAGTRSDASASIELASGREPLAAPEAPDAPEDEGPAASAKAALTGTVVDAESGEPLHAFEVTLLRAVDLPRVAWPESRRFESADGRFDWGELEPGGYAVFVRAGEHATWKANLTALAAGAPRELAVELGRGATVRGFVVDRATALPIGGALVVSETDAPVEVLPLDPALMPSEVGCFAITAADGSFELAQLASGAQVLRASGPEHGRARTSALELREGELADGLLFELDPGGAIEGRVQREGGEPWVGARVIASEYAGQSSGPMTFGSALTDAEGRYRIEPLAAAHYVVLVAPEGESSESMSPDIASVRVRAGDTARADFLRATANGRIFGRIVGSRGEPLPGATINLSPVGSEGATGWRAATAREDGTYSLDDVDPGEYDVHVGNGSGIAYQDTIRSSAGEELRRDFRAEGRRLSGRVTDAATGGPVEGYVLLLVRHVEPNGPERFPALDRLLGKSWPCGGPEYEFPFLRAGRYDLVALSVGGEYAMQIVEDVAIGERDDARVDLALRRGGSLVVRVVDARAAAIAGARIELVDPLGRRIDSLARTTDPKGEARADALEPGVWRVRASASDGRSGEIRLAVEPGVERGETLVLLP